MTTTRQQAEHEPIARVLPDAVGAAPGPRVRLSGVRGTVRRRAARCARAGAVPRPAGRRIRPRKTFGHRPCRQARLAGPGGVGRAGAHAATCAGSPTPSPHAMRAPGRTYCGWPSRRGTPTSRSRRRPSSAPFDRRIRWTPRRGRHTGAASSTSPRCSEGRAARAVWQALPGERWADRLAEAAAVTVNSGRGVLGRRAGSARRRRAARRRGRGMSTSPGWWRCRRVSAPHSATGGGCRCCAAAPGIVIGTRSAVFAPVADLGLVMVWDDGDDTLAEPRAPYPHAREVAMLRAHQLRCAALIGGYARTAEAQALVRSRLGARSGRRRDRWCGPRRRASSRSRTVASRRNETPPRGPPGCRRWRCGPRAPHWRPGRRCSFRCPGAATCPRWRAPVAGPSPDAGTAPARCRCRTGTPRGRCAGGAAATSRHCAAPDAAPTPCAPSSSAPAAPPRNSAGRFPASPSSRRAATRWWPRCPREPAVVVATPGAEPVAAGGYGAALLLDGWALLGQAGPAAAEDALRRWMAAAALVRSRADGGVVAVVAESAIPTVQALIRWDPVGHADAELDSRAEVGLPPAVHMAAVDGAPAAVHALLETAELPDGAELLGPVDLPPGARRPPGTPAEQTGQPDAGAGAARRRAAARGGAATRHRGAQRAARSTSQFVCKSTRCT